MVTRMDGHDMDDVVIFLAEPPTPEPMPGPLVVPEPGPVPSTPAEIPSIPEPTPDPVPPIELPADPVGPPDLTPRASHPRSRTPCSRADPRDAPGRDARTTVTTTPPSRGRRQAQT